MNHTERNMRIFESVYQQIKPSLYETIQSDIDGNKASRAAASKWIVDNPEANILSVLFDPFNKMIVIYYWIEKLENRAVLFSRRGGVTWGDAYWNTYEDVS